MRTKACVPILKAKAFNALVICEWLASVCKDAVQREGTDYAADRACMMWGLHEFFRVLRSSPMWLSKSQLQTLRRARNTFFFLYFRLALLSSEGGSRLYSFIPKFHMMDHLERSTQVTGLSPTSHWAFQDEDNVGLL
eukprot:12837862-Alexandrium_andersonii.AAC.1